MTGPGLGARGSGLGGSGSGLADSGIPCACSPGPSPRGPSPRAPAKHELPRLDGLVGVNPDADSGSGRSVDVAAVPLVAGRESSERRILIMQIDALDTRREERRDRVVARARRAGDDAVLKRAIDRFERELEAVVFRPHRDDARFGA